MKGQPMRPGPAAVSKIRHLISIALGATLLLGLPHAREAGATADGPDYFRVTGVTEGAVLNMRSGPGTEYPKVGTIGSDADGIRNLGCAGGLSFAEWQKATPEQREASRHDRWCRVSYKTVEGWVAGIYLTEGTGPDAAPAATAQAPAAEPGAGDFSWRLVETADGPAAGEGWIRFAGDGTVSGSTGCNTFQGRAVLGPGTANFPQPMASTRMFCAEAEVMAQETAVFSALAEAERWEIDLATGRLTISGPGGAGPLVFVPGAP